MDDAEPQGRPAGGARRRRARRPWFAVAALAALAVVPALALGRGDGGSTGSAGSTGSTGSSSGAAAECPTPARPPRYPDVQPIFEQHCAKCHDARRSKNDAAQAVFVMTSYPFSTKRPGTLLDDLRAMLPKRGSLSAEEKCRGLQWLTAGALDAAGNPPRWR
jgi:hypothetical protein